MTGRDIVISVGVSILTVFVLKLLRRTVTINVKFPDDDHDTDY